VLSSSEMISGCLLLQEVNKQYVNMLRCDIIHTDIVLQVLLWWSGNTAHTIKYTVHRNFHCAGALYITGYICDSIFFKSPPVKKSLWYSEHSLPLSPFSKNNKSSETFYAKTFSLCWQVLLHKIFPSLSVQGILFQCWWHNIIWNVSLV